MSAGPAAVRAAAVLALAYLLLGELLPLPAARALLEGWAAQQVLLLALLSGLLTVLASCSSGSSFAAAPISAASLLAALNVGGLVVSLAPTPWFLVSDNCPVAPGAACDPLAIVLDVVGLVSARLARLDLGLCLVLASRGDSAWLLGATSGALGYAEAIPLHRTAGWWCAGMSALHSATYLLFYLETDGLRSLWVSCFPARTADGKLNRLGLVNFFGLVAAAALLALALPAHPTFRRRCYHVFQRLHLPVAAAFVVCCALHDLEILLFAVPGLASWYVERRTASSCRPRLLPATARSSPAHRARGSSSPSTVARRCRGRAPRRRRRAGAGCRCEWRRSATVAPALRDVVGVGERRGAQRGGVRSRGRLDARARRPLRAAGGGRRFEVEVAGPYPFGGGAWSLSAEGGEQPALLLLAGGTGVTAWLPALSSARPAGRRCHLVWCVQDGRDYLALAKRLPPGGVRVTVHVTRAATGADGPLASSGRRRGRAGGVAAARAPSLVGMGAARGSARRVGRRPLGLEGRGGRAAPPQVPRRRRRRVVAPERRRLHAEPTRAADRADRRVDATGGRRQPLRLGMRTEPTLLRVPRRHGARPRAAAAGAVVHRRLVDGAAAAGARRAGGGPAGRPRGARRASGAAELRCSRARGGAGARGAPPLGGRGVRAGRARERGAQGRRRRPEGVPRRAHRVCRGRLGLVEV